MKMSETRQQRLYGAIHDPIMNLRIELQKAGAISSLVDYRIAQLVHTIWTSQQRILKLDSVWSRVETKK